MDHHISSEYRALRQALDGYRLPALVFIIANLGIADLLSDGSRHSAELAQLTGVQAGALRRVLRALTVAGLFNEGADGKFELTQTGQLLRSDAPRSLRSFAIIVGEQYMPAWSGLMHSVKTGEPTFEHIFGMSTWDYRERNPQLREHFRERAVKRNSWVASVASQTYDFSNNRLIAVIGGGDGTLEEFRRFLFNAGCELTRSIPLGGTTALIEAVSSGF